MNSKAPTQSKGASTAGPVLPSAQPHLLQRQCACGGVAGMSGGCEECSRKQRLGLQTKLKIGAPGDSYEREADRIAEKVMAAPTHAKISNAPPHIQRFAGQSHGQMDAAPASVNHTLANPGRPLEPALRQDMEQRFGHDFGRVRVHTGAAAEQSARDVNANAYTMGPDIVFGAGRFAPGTTEGRRLIAHELTHVVQQRGSNGIRVDPSHEKRGLSPMSQQDAIPTANAQAPGPRVSVGAERAVQREVNPKQIQEAGDQQPLFTVFVADERKRTWRRYARSLGQEDATRIRKRGKLSSEDRQDVNAKLAFFEGEAKEVYIREIRPALVAAEQAAEPPEVPSLKAKATWVELDQGVFAYQVNAGTTINDVAAYLSGHPDLPDILAQSNNLSRTTPLDEAYPVIVAIEAIQLIDRDAYQDIPEHVRSRIDSARQARAQMAQHRRFVRVRSGHPIGPGAFGLIPGTTAAISGAVNAFSALRYHAGFIAGLFKGAGNAVVDLFVGAVDMIKTVGRVLRRLITLDFGGIWKMLMGWIKQLKLLSQKKDEIASDFMDKWEAKDDWARGLFQGEVLGWVMMTVLIVLATLGTAGPAAIAQISGKWKFVIDVLKLADGVGDLGTYVRAVGKLPGEAIARVRKKFGLKAELEPTPLGSKGKTGSDPHSPPQLTARIASQIADYLKKWKFVKAVTKKLGTATRGRPPGWKRVKEALRANPGPNNKKILAKIEKVMNALQNPKLYGEVLGDAWDLVKAGKAADINDALRKMAEATGLPVIEIPKGAVYQADKFFEEFATQKFYIVDNPLGEFQHGAMTHLLQDLVVNKGLGGPHKSAEFRQLLGEAEGIVERYERKGAKLVDSQFAQVPNTVFLDDVDNPVLRWHEVKMRTGDYVWRFTYDLLYKAEGDDALKRISRLPQPELLRLLLNELADVDLK